MQKQSRHVLIFTDLDGTLLDHNSYSAKPADRLIRQLTEDGMASIIPVTSKTRAELLWLGKIIPLQHEIGVSENGSVILTSETALSVDRNDAELITLGIAYGKILEQLARLPSSLRRHVTGFADMSIKQVSAATGLTIEDAERAKKRDATEPFLWSGTDSEFLEIEKLMSATGIHIQQGGRFYHLTGNATKEQAMAKIISKFAQRSRDSELLSIALGDGPNDLAMIEAADFGVIMPNLDGVTITSPETHVRTARHSGPEGWVSAVCEIFAELGFNLPKS